MTDSCTGVFEEAVDMIKLDRSGERGSDEQLEILVRLKQNQIRWAVIVSIDVNLFDPQGGGLKSKTLHEDQ